MTRPRLRTFLGWPGIVSCCLLVLGAHPAVADDALKQRAYVGMGYRAATAAESESLRFRTGGLIVNRVLPASPAERAGLRIGDVIQSVDGREVVDESGLRAILRERYAGQTLVLSVMRAGDRRTLRVVAAALPAEHADSVEIEYTAFSARGARLRAVVASPLGGGGKRLPAVLMVSALHSPQLIGVPFPSLSRDLAYRLARSGFRVIRFELRGFGDSEGEDYRTADFESEIEDNLGALEYLAGRSDVDPRRIFVFGHSTGGIEAAVVAARRPLAGLIVSATIGRTYFERMAETLRLQGQLAGDSGSAIDRTVRTYVQFASAILRGETDTELQRDTTFVRFFNSAGRIMDDRTVEFWRQQLGIGLAEVYARVRCPVLIIYPASDYLTQLACHERIRDVLLAAGNGDVTLRVIPETDHAYSRAKDVRGAFENQRRRTFEGNPAPGDSIVSWLTRH
jgi:pimeloyl-ACP methyl ester carboxylesterase